MWKLFRIYCSAFSPKLFSICAACLNWYPLPLLAAAGSFAFKCFQQKYQSYFSAFRNFPKRKEIQVRWNERIVLQEATQQVKTDNHSSLRTKTALLPAAPETHTRNIGDHLQDCPWARKGWWGEGKLKCHKGLLPGFSHFFSWLSILLGCYKLLAIFQSFDNVDSDSFC